MNLLTIGDFYRERYGRGIEVFCSVAIILSYLGWVAAQITALGLVFSVLSGGAMSETAGHDRRHGWPCWCTWSSAACGRWRSTDFIQMIVLVIGLAIIAVFPANLAGGAGKVVAHGRSKRPVALPGPTPSFTDMAFFIAAAITMMLG